MPVCVCVCECVCVLVYVCGHRAPGPRTASLTPCFPFLSKGGSQRLSGGAEHPVRSAVAVPDALSSEGKVLDPVSGQGQLFGIVAVARFGVPVELGEGALQHTQEAVQVAHDEVLRVRRCVPQDPRDHVIRCAHSKLFLTFYCLWGEGGEREGGRCV